MADLKKVLGGIDLNNISLADLGKITNPALRNALVDVVTTPDAAIGHQNHGSHSDHSTDSGRFLELDFASRRAGRDVGPGP